jgi:DNA-binding MarR family transcriptional regulator
MSRLIDVEHDDFALRTFILFIQSARSVFKYVDASLYNYNKLRFSAIKFIVLQVLANNSRGVMNPTEIANWTQTEKHNITALVKRMKKEGLVSTERNTSNKRFVNITLTNKGREVLSQAMPIAEQVVSQVMSSVTEDDSTVLEKSLRTLRDNAQSGLEALAERT